MVLAFAVFCCHCELGKKDRFREVTTRNELSTEKDFIIVYTALRSIRLRSYMYFIYSGSKWFPAMMMALLIRKSPTYYKRESFNIWEVCDAFTA